MGARSLALALLALCASGPASALSLVNQVNILTALQDNTIPPNCSLTTFDTTVLECETTAGRAKGQVGFGVQRALADTRGINDPSHPIHQASGVADFFENLVFGIDGTLRTALQITGEVAVAPGTVATAGFIQSNWTGADLVSATNNHGVDVRSAVAGVQLQWDFDETSGGAFAETVIFDLAFTAGVPLSFGGLFAASALSTGLLLDFFGTAQVEGFETFDAVGNPVALEIRNEEGDLLATTVPEPALASLAGLVGVALLARSRR